MDHRASVCLLLTLCGRGRGVCLCGMMCTEYLSWTYLLKCMHFRVREPQLGRSGGSMMLAHGAATTNNGLHLMELNGAPFLVSVIEYCHE